MISLYKGDRVVSACPWNGKILVVTEQGRIYIIDGEPETGALTVRAV